MKKGRLILEKRTMNYSDMIVFAMEIMGTVAFAE